MNICHVIVAELNESNVTLVTEVQDKLSENQLKALAYIAVVIVFRNDIKKIHTFVISSIF